MNKIKIGNTEYCLPFNCKENGFLCDASGYAFASLRFERDSDSLGAFIAESLNQKSEVERLRGFDRQLETMIHFGFRYALDRKTGAVTHTINFILSNWERFAPDTQEQMQNEIRRKHELMGGGLGRDNEWLRCEWLEWKKILAKEVSDEK